MLRVVDLAANQLTEVQLPSLASLEFFSAEWNKLELLVLASGTSNLRELVLGGNAQLSRVELPADLNRLEVIDVGDSAVGVRHLFPNGDARERLTQRHPPGPMPNLKRVYAENNALESLTGLTNKYNLELVSLRFGS